MNISKEVMRGRNSTLCLLVVTVAVGYVSGDSICRRGLTWWDRERGACAPCTRCDPARNLAVVYPCELHRDTICQPSYQIQIFPFDKFDKTSNKSDHDVPSDFDYEYIEYESEVINDSEDEDRWDLQASGVTIAASGCVVFFIVVLYFSLTHAKQWRVLKQTLQSDMQDLTAKMKLMEAGMEPNEPPAAIDHHVYCNVHVGKEVLLGTVTGKKGFGNVYTQEKHPS